MDSIKTSIFGRFNLKRRKQIFNDMPVALPEFIVLK